MGEHGFGTKDLIAFIFVVALSLGVSGFLYNDLSKYTEASSSEHNNTYSHNNDSVDKINVDIENYYKLEELISAKSIDYFANNTATNVSLTTLIQNNYIDKYYTVNGKNTDCSGYVSYDKNYHKTSTFLNCGKSYKTEGYDFSIVATSD